MTLDPAPVEKLDRATCMRLLGSVPVGRIAYSADAMPAIQPVNYTLDGDTIVIRTVSSAKLAAARRREIVAFEGGEIDPANAAGSSVLVGGTATAITAPAETAPP